MRLSDLNPVLMDGKDGATGVGLIFDCPCGKCGAPCHVMFRNPISGLPYADRPSWERAGDTFDTLTLAPSIHRDPKLGGCGWHGYIRNGEVISV